MSVISLDCDPCVGHGEAAKHGSSGDVWPPVRSEENGFWSCIDVDVASYVAVYLAVTKVGTAVCDEIE